MSGGDVVVFSHARCGTHYRIPELAFLNGWEERGLFLHHSSSSEFGTDACDVLEDGFTRSVIHLDGVYKVRERGFLRGPARVNFVVWPRTDLW